MPLEIGRVSSVLLLKIGNNERIHVQAQHVLYLTLHNRPPSFFPSSLVPFASQWKRKVCRMFCSAGPLLSQYSQTSGGLEPMSLKSVTMWTIRTKDGRKVKKYIRGNVCQVQSAWKLSIAWRADESQGPNRLVQKLWTWSSEKKDLGYIHTAFLRMQVFSWFFFPHDTNNFILRKKYEKVTVIQPNFHKKQTEACFCWLPDTSLNINIILSGSGRTELNETRCCSISC